MSIKKSLVVILITWGSFLLLSGGAFFMLTSLTDADSRLEALGPVRSVEAASLPDYPPMPGPGKKVPFGNGYYLIYGFDKKPKLGTLIMKVEIFTGQDQKDTSLEVKAETHMPSMPGAHATGERLFKISNKGDYLLPIRIVMPGDWEIKITVGKDGQVIFRGRYDFDV